ncbi:MAG TPA: hypothetical protein VFM68_02985 [Candidatus Saccharimonadales bacterium]|nr:hypothetical protein [Candidatus Saccharimonadales bacterium]
MDTTSCDVRCTGATHVANMLLPKLQKTIGRDSTASTTVSRDTVRRDRVIVLKDFCDTVAENLKETLSADTVSVTMTKTLGNEYLCVADVAYKN